LFRGPVFTDDARVERARNDTIRASVAIGLAFLALIALGVSAWFLASTQSDQREALRARYADRTKIAASLIDSLFTLAFTNQSAQAAQQYSAPHIPRSKLDAAVKQQRLAWSMVVDASGHVLGSSSHAPAAPTAEAIRSAARNGFGVGAVLPGKPPAVDSAVRFTTPTGVRYVVNASPLTAFRTFLDGTLKPLPTLPRSRAFVIDQNNQALGVAISGGRPKAMPSPQLLRALKGHSAAHYRLQGTGIYAASTTIPHTPWRVVSTAAENDLYASVSGLRRWAPWAILILGALTLVAVAFLLQRLIVANRQLAESRQAVELRARELERSNADLEQFAYAASHDLSEPLRTVAGFSQLLRSRYQGRLDAEADEFIGHMTSGVERMQQLIDDLLLYSRVGREPERAEDLDLEETLAEVLRWLAPMIAERDALVTHDPLPVVRGERSQIAQVLQNLVSNAIKFTEPGKVPAVHVSSEREGAFWRIAIRDNGIGVDGASDVIFKMFGRLHGIDAYPGTGIGLALAKRVVEGHGGRIWVESAAGGGSIFFFTLPASSHVREPGSVRVAT
jgi:signal transduction histidine kinase